MIKIRERRRAKEKDRNERISEGKKWMRSVMHHEYVYTRKEKANLYVVSMVIYRHNRKDLFQGKKV